MFRFAILCIMTCFVPYAFGQAFDCKESKLSNGNIYKISFSQSGVYRIDGKFLEDQLGVAPGMSSDALQLFGIDGGRIPEKNSIQRPCDLIEMPLQIFDGGDGVFDKEDYFLFYASGPDRWYFDTAVGRYVFEKNVYDKYNYGFLRVDGQGGKRIQIDEDQGGAEYYSPTYDLLQVYENDRVNLLGAYISTEGSGKDWYGDYFGIETEKDFASKFDFSNVVPDTPSTVEIKMAVRGKTSTTVDFTLGESNFSKSFSSVDLNNIESVYARKKTINKEVELMSDAPITISFLKQNQSDEAWLDKISIVSRANIGAESNMQFLRDKTSLLYEKAGFLLPYETQVWDISDYGEVRIIQSVDLKISFSVGDKIQTILIPGDDYLVPEAIGKIANQNLHQIEKADMVIIYGQGLSESANKLADHRKAFSGLNVIAVNVNEIFNEYSGGRQDPVGIRDFARMLYTRDSDFRYMLLLGDGSYDYRGLVLDLPKENIVPVYETDRSLHPIESYPSDDFYGLLDEDEGQGLLGNLDIAIGRIPVSDAITGGHVVDKIIKYDIGEKKYGPWRTKIGFSADDEDANMHLKQSDGIAVSTEESHPEFIQKKIYFDAYVQESTPGGDRYPKASEDINKAVQNGILVFNYLGHGGPKGWAQERVLKISDIETWNNGDHLPLLITATCSFTGYDDPAIASAGEVCIRKENGGVIALFTTVRAVYSSSNERLTKAVYSQLFERDSRKGRRFGDIMISAKNMNTSGSVSNDRKFALIGDPAQRLAIPTQQVKVESINDMLVSLVDQDTVHALESVTVKGYVADGSGGIDTDFEGTLYVTVYDKKNILETLANDSGSSVRPFSIYRNILFKGTVKVVQGIYNYTFIIPKDINYEIGYGNISHYAVKEDKTGDASGVYNGLIIGGSSISGIIDDSPPVINAFLNDDDFMPGDEVLPDPVFVARLSDDYGINVSGTGIGHDITLVIDGDVTRSIILNDNYQTSQDNVNAGIVKYPLLGLSPGHHTAKIKAWDISNNSAEKVIDFYIRENKEKEVFDVWSYPNPARDHLVLNFSHDLAGNNVDITIEFFDATGRYLGQKSYSTFASQPQLKAELDLDDGFFSFLKKGLYFYKIKMEVRQLNRVRQSKFNKLLIF